MIECELRGLIELFLTMTAEAPSLTHPARPFIQERYTRALGEMRLQPDKAIESGEIAHLSEAEIDQEARTLVAVMDGLELQWLLHLTVDLVGLFDRYLDLAIAGWRRGSFGFSSVGSAGRGR